MLPCEDNMPVSPGLGKMGLLNLICMAPQAERFGSRWSLDGRLQRAPTSY